MERDPDHPLFQRLAGVATGVLLFAILVIWSVSTARYAGPDEPAHVLRAASVATGVLIGDRVPALDPGYRRVEVAAALTTGDPTCFRHDDGIPATCAQAAPDASGVAAAASSAGTYPPYYYALVGMPVRLLGDTADVGWYRVVASGWCAVVLAMAIARSRRVAGVLLVACLTPASWFLFGVVNPNSLEIALAVLAWVGIERIRTSRVVSMADIAWVAGPAAVAILIRPVAALGWLAMAGAALLIDLTGTSDMTVGAPRRRLRLLFVIPPVAAVIASVAWNIWAAVDISDVRTAEDVSTGTAIRTAVEQSTETWREMVGSLGWLEYSAPWFAHVVWWATLALCAWGVATAGVAAGGATLRRAWLWVLAVTVGGPILFEVVFSGSVGFIWQGRYSIASAIGLTIIGFSMGRDRIGPTGRIVVAAAAVTAQVATLWIVLQRYTVGASGSWWFREARWHPAVAPILLVLLDAVLMVGLVVLGAFVDRTQAEHDRDWPLRSAGGDLGNLAAHDVQR